MRRVIKSELTGQVGRSLMSNSDVGAQLHLSYTDFSHAISDLATALPRKGNDPELRVNFDGALVRLIAGGVEVSLEGQGSWSGFVLAPLRPIVLVRKHLPKVDPLSIRFLDGRFYIQSWSIPASWHDIGSELSYTPLNPTILQLLQFKASTNEAKLVSSGMRTAVNAAEEQAQKMMLKAQDILRPLGITLRDIEDLLSRKLQTPNE
jgi:hypothetical protein